MGLRSLKGFLKGSLKGSIRDLCGDFAYLRVRGTYWLGLYIRPLYL